jgi:hypothetical protein
MTRWWLVPVLVAALHAPAAAQRVVFHGEVTAVGTPPKRWTGRVGSVQVVDFAVTTVVSGQLADPAVSVHFFLFLGDPDADAVEPRLRGDLFQTGKTLEVTMERGAGADGTQIVWVGVSPTREVPRAPPTAGRRRNCLGCSSSSAGSLGAVTVLLLLCVLPRRKR